MDEQSTDAYLGLTAEAAQERAREEGLLLRVLEPGSLYTLEYREDRINVTVSDGVVIKVTRG
jgi:hypothetical protein